MEKRYSQKDDKKVMLDEERMAEIVDSILLSILVLQLDDHQLSLLEKGNISNKIGEWVKGIMAMPGCCRYSCWW